MPSSPEEWIWRLGCVEKEFARLPREPCIYNVFVSGRDVLDVDISRIGCLRFSWSRIAWPEARASRQGTMCVDLAARGPPRLMRWELDRDGHSNWAILEDWPANPPGETSTWVAGRIDWNTFYCIGAQVSSWRDIEFGKGLSGWHADYIYDLEHSLLSCCRDAPRAVLEQLGDLSELSDLPTCLLYLALRGAHPLLAVRGDLWPRHARERRQHGPLKRSRRIVLPRSQRYIVFIPDYLTAVKYLFETLRHVAESDVGNAADLQEQTPRLAALPNDTHRPTAAAAHFEFGLGQVLYGGKDLGLATGFRIDVLQKLRDSFGRTVGYQTLHSDSDPVKASDQLRGAISAINQALSNAKTPYKVINCRSSGYLLR